MEKEIKEILKECLYVLNQIPKRKIYWNDLRTNPKDTYELAEKLSNLINKK